MSDHCRGIDLDLEQGRPGEVYNIGGGLRVENLSWSRRSARIADDAFEAKGSLRPFPGAARSGLRASLIQFVKDRPGHDRRYAIDCGKIEEQIGFRCRHTLEEGLRDTFSWYLDHETWWRRNLGR